MTTPDIGENKAALENFRVCLKMLFNDLISLNDPKVREVLEHYRFNFEPEYGRVDVTLPRKQG